MYGMLIWKGKSQGLAEQSHPWEDRKSKHSGPRAVHVSRSTTIPVTWSHRTTQGSSYLAMIHGSDYLRRSFQSPVICLFAAGHDIGRDSGGKNSLREIQ